MWNLINICICFAISFVVFYVGLRMFKRFVSEKEYKDNISQKIETFIEGRSSLGRAVTSRLGSAFVDKEKEKFEELLASNSGFLEKIKLKLKEDGIKISISRLVILCFITGVLIVYVFLRTNAFDIPLNSILVGMPIGCFIVYAFLSHRAERERALFLQQFPDALDMMIRGVKAGFNLTRLIRLVASEAKDPIASTFRLMMQKLELGVPADRVFVDTANDVNIEEFRFLSVAFILQLENGGMLVEILGNLSSLVRKRLELQLKIRALSSESRASAYVLCALPFAFAIIMMFLNPNHLMGFLKPGLGQTLLKVCCALFFVGVIVMFKLTKLKV